ncbi:MAG: CoA ester lyase [Rhodovulum sulfidophilum]|uniref:CoA ester lyase n=1 Tax=Rhodovulum sulfidophilum TaxID=35806 RepID=A0A2W5N2C2_RHOSU|nr:MAG: CoA ester lyase [Rhodovulum sulfidophilum]
MQARTYLFVPGDRTDRFAKALATGADRVIIDLEDAVKPAAKAAARAGLAGVSLDWSRVVLRVNDAASPWWAEDWAAVAALPVVAVLVPKAEDPAVIARALADLGRPVEVIPQIETARGLEELDGLLRAPGVRRAAFGHLDFAVDLGAAPDWEAMLLARATLVLRSRLAGRVAPIDSVTPDIADEAALRREAEAARRLGFGGKLLIHPRQVAPAFAAFGPSEAEVDWARRVLAALEAEPGGAVSVDGKMIDKPVADAARRVLALAKA